MKKKYTHFHITVDHKEIFFSTNFDIEDPLEVKSKPLLVFNYGLVCNNEHWSRQLPFFDEKNFRILIHNYRGHFNSTGQNDLPSCDFENFVRDLKSILDFLKVKEAIMIGHSMGVNITLEFAKKHQKILKGMILISGTVLSPSSIMFDSQIMELIFPAAKKFSEVFPRSFEMIWNTFPYSRIIQKAIRQGGFNPDKVPLEFIEHYLLSIKQLPHQLFFQLFKMMVEHDILEHLDTIQTPTLIIGGEKDKIIPNRFQELLKSKLKNSEFYLVKDGSHVPQVDFPEYVNERMLAFLEKLPK